MAVKKSVPRFVLSLQDTKTEVDGPMGRQYYNITVGFSSKQHLLRSVSKFDGASELQHIIDTFFDTVEKMGKRKGGETKGFTQVGVTDDAE